MTQTKLPKRNHPTILFSTINQETPVHSEFAPTWDAPRRALFVFFLFTGFVAFAACGGGVSALSHCSTKQAWTGGGEGSPMMNPGGNCISCHAKGEGPKFTSAGTVMGALHDSDTCYGTSGVTVTLIGAHGKKVSTTTNETGNFFFRNVAIDTPYTVELRTKDGKTKRMGTPQKDFNCMNCHTAEGKNGAPGRITMEGASSPTP